MTARLYSNRVERDRLIRAVHADGVSLRPLAEIAGMSHTNVRRIIQQKEGA